MIYRGANDRDEMGPNIEKVRNWESGRRDGGGGENEAIGGI
jgi:hypothetical protein